MFLPAMARVLMLLNFLASTSGKKLETFENRFWWYLQTSWLLNLNFSIRFQMRCKLSDVRENREMTFEQSLNMFYPLSALLSSAAFLLILRRPSLARGCWSNSGTWCRGFPVLIVGSPIWVFRGDLSCRLLREVAFVEGHVACVVFITTIPLLILSFGQFIIRYS